MKSSTPFVILVLTLVLSADTCTQTQDEGINVAIKSIDFAPTQGGYDIAWANRGRTPTYSEVKQYRFSLNSGGSDVGTFFFDIYEDKFGSDPYLGTIQVDFASGVATVRYANSTGGVSPTNAPAGGTVGSFWLACTGGKGKVRGNGAHGDDGQADVYVQIQSLHQSSVRSPNHRVRCT